MTPLHLQILLWLHTRPTPYAEHEPAHANSPAAREYTKHLLDADLIELDPRAHPADLDYTPSGYRTTDKGLAYVEALCGLPIPICKWVIAATVAS